MTLPALPLDPSALIPVCSWCKRVRNSRGVWLQFNAKALTICKDRFTHGICPGCSKSIYSELSKEI